MLKYDKIKIVSSLNNISNINENEFKTTIKDGVILEQSYSMRTPFSLYIEADYEENELVLEITGKILKDKYPQLICIDTINQCLQNINEIGVCNLNIGGILMDGKVVKCDVTQDVPYPNCQQLCKNVKTNVCSYKKYQAEMRGGNLEISKSVKSKTRKLRLTIYDKEQEMHLATNRDFLLSCKDSASLLDYFNGKVRFELNLNSMKQIRKNLNIANTSVKAVLTSSATPIWDFLNTVIEANCTGAICHSMTELKNMLVLEYCNKDLEKVEALLRNYYSKNTHISQVMQPYRMLLAKMSEDAFVDIKKLLKNMLTESSVDG